MEPERQKAPQSRRGVGSLPDRQRAEELPVTTSLRAEETGALKPARRGVPPTILFTVETQEEMRRGL